MMKSKTIITLASSLVVAGLVIGCGSSNNGSVSNDETKKPGDTTPKEQVDVRKCVVSPLTKEINKGEDFNASKVITVKSGDGKVLSNPVFKGEVKKNVPASYDIEVSHPSCDNKQKVVVKVKEPKADTTGSINKDGTIDPF